MKTKYTKERLEPIVKDCICLTQVLRKLELKLTGGSQSHIKNLIKRHGIDTSHFTGQACRKGIANGCKKHWYEILVLMPLGSYQRSHAYMLRRALVEFGRDYKCEKCFLKDEWNGQVLVLEIDHKNNNWLDNRPENLSFLCPNCHSQKKCPSRQLVDHSP